ncbi:MAG: hypothetical protein H0T50_05760 [Gemmatimonadales bacterium]|nr:hypothetical protein [Gemmatimonadales bacterium]
MKRELFLLLASVLMVDALFIAGFFLFQIDAARHPVKIGYTAVWTVVTLLVVLRSLARIRTMRRRGAS